MRTDHFIRFERVDFVEQTSRGLLARLHGELLRVEAVRPDVVRLQLSRGGVFDEKPTYAVCVDPFGADGQHVAFDDHSGHPLCPQDSHRAAQEP